MGIKGSGTVGPKALANLTFLAELWADKKARVIAQSEDFDYSNHGDEPHNWDAIEAEATNVTT